MCLHKPLPTDFKHEESFLMTLKQTEYPETNIEMVFISYSKFYKLIFFNTYILIHLS